MAEKRTPPEELAKVSYRTPATSWMDTPVDFRKGKSVPPSVQLPAWTSARYTQIKMQLVQLPAEGNSGEEPW